jgi:hypothetical protein
LDHEKHAKPEGNQRRKLRYLPPEWSLVAIVALVVIVTFAASQR